MSTLNSIADTQRPVDELSPKKVILLTRRAGFYLLSKWKIILVVSLLSGLAAAAYTFFKRPVYLAEITFTIDEEIISNEKTGLAAFSEELGFGPMPDAGTIFSSLTNIVELIRSRTLIEKTLRNSVTINDKKILFANFFLDSLDYREKWVKKNLPYKNLDFLAGQKGDQAIFESGLIRAIYEVLINEHIKIDSKGKGTSIISVSCMSKHELFSKYFLEALINEVTQYYIESKTRRSKINLALIEKRTDSMRGAYNRALYGRASFTDAHINPAKQRAAIPGEKQQTDVQILKASYTELVRSLESARTSLMRDTPLIQILDTPILPLKNFRQGYIKRFVIFFILAAFLLSCWFLARKTYFVILNS